MIYPKRFSINGGIIVADVMLALALAAIMVSGITAMSLEARSMYDRAQFRSLMISAYESHSSDFAGMMPYQTKRVSFAEGSTSVSVNIAAAAKWYGNDRIETNIAITSGGQSMEFSAVRNYPLASISDAAGTPLCSPDMGKSADPADISITSVMLPINPLLPLTDLEVRNDIAYISADSSTAADPDLLIADISDPKHASILSTLDTGPGIRSLTIAGSYVFAAAASKAAQLHVIRLNSLSGPVLAKKYKMPLPAPSSTPAMASAIYYDRGIIYLGTEKWEGNEFQAIDVSDPNSPTILGGYDIDSKINDIQVRDKIAYIASADRNQLQILDVSSPAHPASVKGFIPDGWERQEGQALSVFEDTLNFSRTSGGFDIPGDHELFSWPAGSSSPLSLNVPGGVYGIVADRHYLYLATRDLNREFTILDRSLSSSSARYYSLPVLPQTMTCDKDRLYILAHNAPVIYEITLNSS